MREGSEPAGRSLSPGKARKTPLPSSVSRSSRRDLQGPRREGAPQRIDKTGIKKIGVVTQALRQIGLTAIRCAPCLRAKLARLADDGARLGSARHRIGTTLRRLRGRNLRERDGLPGRGSPKAAEPNPARALRHVLLTPTMASANVGKRSRTVGAFSPEIQAAGVGRDSVSAKGRLGSGTAFCGGSVKRCGREVG